MRTVLSRLLVVALVLLGGVMTAPAASAAVRCAAQTDDYPQAFAIARACGTEVLVVSRSTATASVYARPDLMIRVVAVASRTVVASDAAAPRVSTATGLGAGTVTVGRCASGTVACGATAGTRARVLWDFGYLDPLYRQEVRNVAWAGLSIYGVAGASCAPADLWASWQPTYGSGSISLASAWARTSVRTVAFGAGCGATGQPRWIGLDALAAVKGAVGQGTTTVTLGVQAPETTTTAWRTLSTYAKLSMILAVVPSTPAVSLIGAGASCGGAATTTPTLSVGVSSPVYLPGSATFTVRDPAGATVWTGTSAQSQNISSAQVTVPSGVLTVGAAYSVTALVTDTAGRRSASSAACSFTVSGAAPAVPAVTVTPSASNLDGTVWTVGYPAGVAAGGVDIGGVFEVSVPTPNDVVSYAYSFDSTSLSSTFPAAAYHAVSYWPSTAGSHLLRIRAVDSAGTAGPITEYRFEVAPTTTLATWNFTEGSGVSTADAITGQVLTLSSSALWSRGVQADTRGSTDDYGLHLTAAGQSATTSAVLPAAGSFSVAVDVKTDDLTGVQTVLRQGSGDGAFVLGLRACAGTAQGVCWFARYHGQEVTAGNGTAVGSWAYVRVAYDAASSALELFGCGVGVTNNSAGLTTGVTPTSAPSGSFVVGQGSDGTWLHGSIDNIRVLSGLISANDDDNYCYMGT